MKILFLDIDGVLNHYNKSTPMNPPEFNNLCNPIILNMVAQLNNDNVASLKKILINYPDLKIVITSAWRKKYNLIEFQNLFQELNIDNEIIGLTDSLGADSRAEEIQSWINQNPTISNFAILDDCYIIPLHQDFKNLQNNFFKTNKMKGLSDQDSIKLISHFQELKC